ncbi:MAG: hypothetical protein DME49_09585 [Verrucomicrobia bacterium]|nr:MAG: hypothetical protein DME49_09585 [Verrucomicrobiota bacterium]PYK92436.1 MAG: hypothetical protein DME36_13480 [Verrucomicrobiota bacterium]PYL38536.1 MAG: hypothetical protein DMF34_06605 [Verrucomicrobiota bacterium]
MKSKNNYVTRQSGQIFGVLIIMIVLLGVGLWMLFAYKQSTEKEGREFGNEAIQKLAVQHDPAFLASRLGPAARLDFPPSAQQDLISRLQQLGTPVGPIDLKGDVKFQSQFFEPRGFFSAHVNYPTRGAQIELGTSHPVGRWQIDTLALNLDPER